MSGSLVAAFPKPKKILQEAFEKLRRASSGDPLAIEALGPLADLERPWDPPTCKARTRNALWLWLDEVVAWLNHEYARQPDHAIPACWPLHPDLVREIALLASQRLLAGRAFTHNQLIAWHQTALPDFYTRMLERLGGSPCHPGQHKPWPAASRYADYSSADATTTRTAIFDGDAG